MPSRRGGAARTGAVLALLAACAGCSPSAGAMKARADDLPGVIEVRVPDNGGEGDIPFSQPSHRAVVTMAADAPAGQILAVLEALGDDVDDGDLTSIDVRFLDDRSATLLAADGSGVAPRLAEELVEARDDPGVVAYARRAVPVYGEVFLELRDRRLESALAAADRYLGRRDLDSVTVRAGGFLIIRDRINARLAFTAARERLASEVDDRVGLTGASITGRGTLKLCAAPGDVDEVEAYLDRTPRADDAEPIGVVAATAEACRDIYL